MSLSWSSVISSNARRLRRRSSALPSQVADEVMSAVTRRQNPEKPDGCSMWLIEDDCLR